MAALKGTSQLSNFLRTGPSSRVFVTVARPLQCKKNEDNAQSVKEAVDSCKKDDDSAQSVKEAADSVKAAADSVTENVKKVSDKVAETADVLKDKATEMLSLGAAKIATEVVKKKAEMKEKKNKK